MKTFLNERALKFGRFLATTLSITGLLLLVTATVTTFIPRWQASGFPILILGIVASIIGIRFSNRWVRPPIAHEALEGGLKGIGKENNLLHYYGPAGHILITPNGIFTLHTIMHPFMLTISGSRWTDHDAWFKKLNRAFTQMNLGNPIKDAKGEAQRVEKYITRHFPDQNIPVTPLIVFANPKTHLEVVKQPEEVSVVYADKRKPTLKTHLRPSADQTAALTPNQMTALRELFLKS